MVDTSFKRRRGSASDIVSLGVLLLIVGGSVYYQYTNRPCAKPITYDIGTFDTQFGISQEEFLKDAAEAASLWNTEAGKTVLTYSSSAKMPVNLIYDSRQQLTDTGKSISTQEDSLDSQKSSIAALQNQYTTMKQQIQSDEASGKSVGGINAEIDSLNLLGSQLQSQTQALNDQIAQVNAQARQYNTHTGSDFQEGEYIYDSGTMRINIYEFMNHTQLVRVLAHEFGHSLGLGHNSDPDSIMYPENTSTSLVLSPEDKAALTARCTFSLQNLNPFADASPSSQ